MAAAEALTITRGIDDKVNVVDERLEGVDVKVEGIQDQVQIGIESIQDQVQIGVVSIQDQVQIGVASIEDQVQIVDSKLECVDDGVRGVDHKVSSVIEGELYYIAPLLGICSQPCTIRCKGSRRGDSTSRQSSQRHKEFVIV
jgi:hypothetical protein